MMVGLLSFLLLPAVVLGQDLFLQSDAKASVAPPATGIDAHVLDISRGAGAEGVQIDLHYQNGTDWSFVKTQATQPSGRTDLFCTELSAGTYRLTFHVEDYFKAAGRETFYPEVVIHFKVKDTELHQNFHVPITLAEFGYSTYRGV
mmetsp:Transcript_73299/g.136994  ORF Transcript_73299/g.136994 Transcript_73299/m.136994 type:complete len:146 (-) Transcript_73299:136-573(-)